MNPALLTGHSVGNGAVHKGEQRYHQEASGILHVGAEECPGSNRHSSMSR